MGKHAVVASWLVWTLSSWTLGEAFVAPGGLSRSSPHHTPTSTTRRDMMIDPNVASLAAGSIAGAVGVGVSFPLDTIKTKSQVMRQQLRQQLRQQRQVQGLLSPQDEVESSSPMEFQMQAGGDAAVVQESFARREVASAAPNMFQVMNYVWQNEGWEGFFGGVRPMVIGQALIKAVSFSTNAAILSALQPYADTTDVSTLIFAACMTGFVSSFLVSPIERVKVILQATGKSTYVNELDCLNAIVQAEGWEGVFRRGLGTTMAREVVSDGIYFSSYAVMMQAPLAPVLGWAAPLVFGAVSGCASWVPVYPVDVVKTAVQNTKGGEQECAWEVAKKLYQEDGLGGFYDGITPKMLRAAVFHAVTFFTYDLIIKSLQ